MQTSEIISKLKNLQGVLAEKYEIEKSVKELPKGLDTNLATLERSKRDYIDLNAEYEAKKADVAALKSELEDVVKVRESGEKNMDDIKTHREYEVLEKQISEAKERETRIRKKLQKEEKELSEKNDKLQEEEAVIAGLEASVSEDKADLAKKLDEYTNQINALKEQEAEMSEGIDAEIIYKFQRIIQRDSKGVVAVRGNVCDGCHMILPAQFANEIRDDEKILFCPYCSRILYYEESAEGEANFFSMDDAGSLASLDDDYEDEDDEEQSEDALDNGVDDDSVDINNAYGNED